MDFSDTASTSSVSSKASTTKSYKPARSAEEATLSFLSTEPKPKITEPVKPRFIEPKPVELVQKPRFIEPKRTGPVMIQKPAESKRTGPVMIQKPTEPKPAEPVASTEPKYIDPMMRFANIISSPTAPTKPSSEPTKPSSESTKPSTAPTKPPRSKRTEQPTEPQVQLDPTAVALLTPQPPTEYDAEFIADLAQWTMIDNRIREIESEVGTLKKQRTPIANRMIKYMSTKKESVVPIENGKLFLNNQTTTAPLTTKIIEAAIKTKVTNQADFDYIMEQMQALRPVKTYSNIKRVNARKV